VEYNQFDPFYYSGHYLTRDITCPHCKGNERTSYRVICEICHHQVCDNCEYCIHCNTEEYDCSDVY